MNCQYLLQHDVAVLIDVLQSYCAVSQLRIAGNRSSLIHGESKRPQAIDRKPSYRIMEKGSSFRRVSVYHQGMRSSPEIQNQERHYHGNI